MGSTMVANELTIYCCRICRLLRFASLGAYGASSKTSFQSLPKSAFSGSYYRGGFEHKMPKQEAALTAGVSSTNNKGKIRAALLQIMLFNHPNKGGSPYITAKINEAKDLLQGQAKKNEVNVQ
uniref:Mitochondrial import inner membrane translocase subunit TIM14 n=1 Tax=Ursus maritimus TaxID=29073 RepID=A0A452SYT4_URSMA